MREDIVNGSIPLTRPDRITLTYGKFIKYA